MLRRVKKKLPPRRQATELLEKLSLRRQRAIITPDETKEQIGKQTKEEKS